ncbi:hypothetical protein Hanom_Chr06g00564351 [Helianthus anomalus]
MMLAHFPRPYLLRLELTICSTMLSDALRQWPVNHHINSNHLLHILRVLVRVFLYSM